MLIKPNVKFAVAAGVLLFILTLAAATASALLLPNKYLWLTAVFSPIVTAISEIYLYLYFKSISYLINHDTVTVNSGVIIKRTGIIYLSRKTAEVKLKIPFCGVVTVISVVGKRKLLLCNLP